MGTRCDRRPSRSRGRVSSAVAIAVTVLCAVSLASVSDAGWTTPRARATDAGTERSAAPGRAARTTAKALPSGPCPLAPLAICEKLNYVVIEEELRAKDAAESCARMPTGRRLACGFARGALATLSRATNFGRVAFAREASVVPLFGGARRASRQASYDHALASLCDLRQNKLCGAVVEQRIEFAGKRAEQATECSAADALGDQWETSKSMCARKAAEIRAQKKQMDDEVRELELEYEKKFGGPASKETNLKNFKKFTKSSKGKVPSSVNCRSVKYGDKPENDDLIVVSLKDVRDRLVQTRASGGYCNKEAIDSIVNSKSASSRSKAMKNLVLPGKYFEHCDGVLKHLDFMIDLLNLQRKAKVESTGKQYQPWCDEVDGGDSFASDGTSADAKEFVARRKEMSNSAKEITSKRVKFEREQLKMMEELREECTTRLNAVHKLHSHALTKCQKHDSRLRVLREDINTTETNVERIVPALDQVITAIAIVGATPESAASLASAMALAELAEISPTKDQFDLKRMLGAEPLATLRKVCTQSAILGAGGGKRDATKSCPDFQSPGPISCAQSCAAMEEASIGRAGRRDKPFSLGIIAGIAIGYILFAKLRLGGSLENEAQKSKTE